MLVVRVRFPYNGEFEFTNGDVIEFYPYQYTSTLGVGCFKARLRSSGLHDYTEYYFVTIDGQEVSFHNLEFYL